MTNNDQFQRDRAIEARSWMNSLEYKRLTTIQKSLSSKADRDLGHVSECTLTKCASNCKRFTYPKFTTWVHEGEENDYD